MEHVGDAVIQIDILLFRSVGLFLRGERRAGIVLDLNSAPFCEEFHRLGKSDFLHLHDEFDNIAALMAAEAVIDIFFRRDRKRRRFFVVERAAAPPLVAPLLKLHVLADD